MTASDRVPTVIVLPDEVRALAEQARTRGQLALAKPVEGTRGGTEACAAG